MEASQREKYKSGAFTKQCDTRIRGRGKWKRIPVDCNRYRNEEGGGGVDKRYWPRIVRFPYSLGRVQSTIANRDSKKTVLNGEEVKDFQRKIGRD